MSRLDPQLPATPAVPPPAAIPVASLAYHSAQTNRRPGILTAVGVISIVLACFSAMSCLISGMYVIGLWFLMRVMPTLSHHAMPVPAGPLNVVEVAQVVRRVQSSVPQGLNAAQVQALTAALRAPNQKLVPPQYAWSPILSAVRGSGGYVTILFNNGNAFNAPTLTISPTGQTTALSSAGSFPNPIAHLKISQVALGIALGEDIASVALAVYLMIIGILMLRDSPYSRKGHLRYAMIKIALSIIALVASYTIGRQFFSSIHTVGTPSAIMMLPSFVVFAILTLAYPVALLITMNTAEVRRHYTEAH